MKSEEIKKYFLLAKKIAKKAYAPYSNFHVGVVLLSENGRVYHGFNIENIVLSLGICAEKIAFGNAFNDNNKKFKAIFIYSPDAKKPISPCGGCRQFMSEFVNDNFDVYFSTFNFKNIKHYSLSELLPEKPF